MATLKKYLGASLRVDSRKRYGFPCLLSVKSLSSDGFKALKVVLAGMNSAGRAGKTAFNTGRAIAGPDRGAEYNKAIQKEWDRVGKALTQTSSRFAIPFLIECEVIGSKFQRRGEEESEWDVRARVVPYQGEGAEFRNAFCEAATFSLKGSAYARGGGSLYCEFEWTFYMNGKRLLSMADEYQGVVRIDIVKGEVQPPVMSGTKGLVSVVGSRREESLPIDLAAGSALTGEATRFATQSAVPAPGRRGDGAGGKWKPDSVKVREALRNYVADRYSLPLTDPRGQAWLNEVYTAQSPARWLLFIAHQTGQLYGSDGEAINLRDGLVQATVYRSDEQASALAENLKKVLDTAFQAFLVERAKTGRGLPDQRRPEAEKLFRRYDLQLRQLDKQLGAGVGRLDARALEARQALRQRIRDTAESALADVIRVEQGLAGSDRARREARNAPGDNSLEKFANYGIANLGAGSGMKNERPYNARWASGG
ncbi:hypothetical protein [Kribbella sp. NPDC055071]